MPRTTTTTTTTTGITTGKAHRKLRLDPMLVMLFLTASTSLHDMVVHAGCRHANWRSSFDDPGKNRNAQSKCDGDNEYIHGLYRNARVKGDVDHLGFIETADCCTPPAPYNDAAAFVTQTMYANWYYSFNNNNNWNKCPEGYFLTGLMRSGGNDRLFNIEAGRCMKPARHPHSYGDCYEQNIVLAFDKANWGSCDKGSDYFVTGLYRGKCDELFCLEYMTCCRMSTTVPVIDSMEAAKARVMDETMRDIATLASYLGYDKASSNWGHVGEDFKKIGDSWVGQTKQANGDSTTDGRLEMKYGDVKLVTSDKTVQWGDPIITDAEPFYVQTGRSDNSGSSVATTMTLGKKQYTSREITNTLTSSWKSTTSIGISVGYQPPSLTGGPTMGFSANFGSEQGGESSNGNKYTETSETSAGYTVTVPPHICIQWSQILSRTQNEVPYNQTVFIHFSIELHGSKGTHKIGDANTSFYAALKQQSKTGSGDWPWNSVKNTHPDAQTIIDRLTDETRYKFHISGKFDEVKGNDIQVKTIDCPPDVGK